MNELPADGLPDPLVAGRALVDQVQHFYTTILCRNSLTESDLEAFTNLRRKVEKVQLLDRFGSKQPATGTLYITTTHLIFVANEEGSQGQETWVLHSQIALVEKGQLTAAGCPLHIRCKNFLYVGFLIQRERECHDVYLTLGQLSQPMHVEEVYAFSYIINDMEKNEGWDIVKMDADFQRHGLPNDFWALCELNQDYSLCETYPSNIYVPRSVPTKVLIACSKFRSKNRLPVLSYINPENQATITRCSQPLAGFSARCVEDEEMFQHILKTNPNFNVLYLVDTRPVVNAYANKAAGKGFEDENFYKNMKSYFFAIENIHVMRASLQKLIETCSQKQTVTSFLNGIDSSGWLKHVRSVLESAVFVAESITRGISCVIHCSDGWDRTAQTTSLACLLLDPFYRTVKGFQTLIEKDWLSFGHKFSDRCGHTSQSDVKEQSPIFTQFLDCVWQITQQFPQAFQFNERFLFTLNDHVYSCQFGTFLGNCEKDRIDLKLFARTYSLWGFMARSIDDYLNPLFDYKADITQSVLRPDLRPQFIRFWCSMYNRFDPGFHPSESVCDRITMAKDRIEVLEDHISLLNQKIAELKSCLGKSPMTTSAMKDSGLFAHSADLTSPRASAEYVTILQKSSTDCSLDSENTHTSESGVEDFVSMNGVLVNAKASCNSSTLPLSRTNNDIGKSMERLRLSAGDMCLSPEMTCVAVQWKSLRDCTHCSCGTQLLYFVKKHHCRKCGNVFCGRCIEVKTSLVGLASQKLVPICKKCCSELTQSVH